MFFSYRHTGPFTSRDAFILLLSDGSNSITTEIPIYIEPRPLDVINDVYDTQARDVDVDNTFPEFDYDLGPYTRLSGGDASGKYARYDDVLPNDEAGVVSGGRYSRYRTVVVDKQKPHLNDVLSHEKQGSS